MANIERILVATDLSAPASWAETRAGMLAQAHGASLDLMHAVSSSALSALRVSLVGKVTDPEKVMASLGGEVDKAAAALEAAYGVQVRRHVFPGRPADEILRLAGECSSQLLVAGAHGSHLVHRLLFGSTIERLLYRSELPLLIVKRSPQEQYRRLIIAVDFSDFALAAARFAAQLLPETALAAFHAAESPFEGLMRFAGVPDEEVARHRAETLAQAESQMAAFLGAADLSGRATWRLDYGYPVRVLEQEVERASPDLLVLGKHGRSAVERWMVGSMTAHLARTADCDVLVVPGLGT